jgi:hypothetical protein
MNDMHLKNVPYLVSTCLVLHNICIILGDEFLKTKWLQEALDEVHNGLPLVTPPGPTRQEKFSVTNHAMHTLAGVEKNPEKHWSTSNKRLQENIKFQ